MLVKFSFCILLSRLPALLMKSTKIDGVQRFITETTINMSVYTYIRREYATISYTLKPTHVGHLY
jgi:hypothetical protein